MSTRDVDRGYQALLKRAKLRGKITVGIHAREGDEPKEPHEGEQAQSGLTLLQVATWLHFGTETQPPRPFVSGWFDENQDMAKEAVSRMARQVLEGKVTRDQAMERLGLFFVGKMQLRLTDGLSPGNKQSTIDKKGSDKAGIDTGQTRSAITHRVEQ